MISIGYLVLAILGLGFLVFIHELGHYFMARRVGMRVEAFSIGFGKPIYTWERDKVQWRICWLPFGGYVKIAGMEKQGDVDPADIPDGFFGKSPLDRMLVAFMGPLVNLAFAFFIFLLLWGGGGREKHFAELTQRVGRVDPQSELYQQGVRSGDIISAYGDREMTGFKEHLYAAMMTEGPMTITGFHVDYNADKKTPFAYTVESYPHPNIIDKEIKTFGVLHSASYVVFDQQSNVSDLMPMHESGIQHGDRIVWADGERVFSLQQLVLLVNDNRALLTIERQGQKLQARVPRVHIEELRFGAEEREEVIDWQHEAKLREERLETLAFIPYNITSDCFVERQLRLVDNELEAEFFPQHLYSDLELPLQPGDRIIAVDGKQIKRAHELLQELQERDINIIVTRDWEEKRAPNWIAADKEFDRDVNAADLDRLTQTIATGSGDRSAGNLHLLKRITPKPYTRLAMSEEQRKDLEKRVLEQKKRIQEIEDTELRTAALAAFEEQEKHLYLGLSLRDRKITYNPSPFVLFNNVFSEALMTLKAFASGYLSPRFLAGPIGIVQVIHHHWMISIKEALFWIAAISLNLGIINLLPLPILDGGYICLSLFEMITRRKISSRMLERLVIPFAVLLIGFFLYLTYHDISRIFVGLFKG